MSEVNLKKAPQRDVLSIDRIGTWGAVQYHHRLACGHTEVRKRVSPASKLACSWCVIAVEKKQQLDNLPVRANWSPTYEDESQHYDTDIDVEVEAARIRAGLVSFLDCHLESVEVMVGLNDNGELSLQGCVVFLDTDNVKRLLSKANVKKIDGDTPL